MVSCITQASDSSKIAGRGRHLKGAVLGTMGFCTRWAVDAHGVGPEWIEVSQIDLHLRKLPKRLCGMRIAHISDLHHSTTVSGSYLRRCIDRINALDVDVVVLTGDYITYDFRGRYREKVVALLGHIKSRLGVYACLGNHDYGVKHLSPHKRLRLLGRLTQGMEAGGVNVLRNESAVVDVEGYPLWFVGLGDLWVGDFQPEEAFADVPTNEVSIALIHNPRGAERLGDLTASVVMSGHTHGRKTTIAAWPMKPSQARPFHAGMYEVEGRKLYVNRGLGRVGRARFNARPEITVYTLR